MPSLLNKVHPNIKAGAGSDENIFALFEIGKVHVKGHLEDDESGLPKQMNRLSFVLSADSKYRKSKYGSAYYQAKKYVDLITNNKAVYEPLDTNEYPLTAPYQKQRASVILLGDNRTPIGVVGEFQTSVSKAFKLPEYCSGFEIDTDLLREHRVKSTYQPLSQYPSSIQDITFDAKSTVSWGQLYALVHAELAVAKAELGYEYNVEPLDIYQAEGSENKRYSVRITLVHHHKTLKTEEVNDLLEQIAKAVHEEYQATRI
jgi:phenylalanyl-tRNA synthetase beta subunit